MTFKICSFCSFLLLFYFSSVSSFVSVQQPFQSANNTDIKYNSNSTQTVPKEQTQQQQASSFLIVPNMASIWNTVGNGFKGLKDSVKNGEIMWAAPSQNNDDHRMCNMHAMQDVGIGYFIVGILFFVIFIVGVLLGVIFVNYRNKKTLKLVGVQTEEENGNLSLKNINSGVQIVNRQVLSSSQNVKKNLDQKEEKENLILGNSSEKQNQNLNSEFSKQENDENVANNLNSNLILNSQQNVQNKNDEKSLDDKNDYQISLQQNGYKVAEQQNLNQRNNLNLNANQKLQQNHNFQNFDGQSVTTVESIIDDRLRDFVVNGGIQKFEPEQNAVSSTISLIDDLQLELHGNNNSNLFSYDEQIYQNFQHQFFNQLRYFQNKKELSDENQLSILKMIQSMVDNSRFQKLKQESLQWKQKSADAQTEILNLKRKKTEIDEFLRLEKEAQQIASDCLVLGFILKGIFIIYQCMRINYIQYMKCNNKYRKCTGFFCFLFNVNMVRSKFNCFFEALTGPGLGLLLIIFLGYILVLQQQFSVGQMRRNFASVMLFFVFVVPGGYAIKLMGGSWWIWSMSSLCWCLFCLVGVDLMMKVGASENVYLSQDDNVDGNQSVGRKRYKMGLDFSVKAVYSIIMVVLFPMLEVLLPFIIAV